MSRPCPPSTAAPIASVAISRAGRATAAAYAATAVHHVYGGLTDDAPNRLLVPVVLAPAFLAGLLALHVLRRRRNGLALGVFCAVAVVVWVVLVGGLHGLYAHVYKVAVFTAGGSPQLYRSLNPEEHHPPDDLLFEATGVLDVAAACWVAHATIRLVAAARRRS